MTVSMQRLYDVVIIFCATVAHPRPKITLLHVASTVSNTHSEVIEVIEAVEVIEAAEVIIALEVIEAVQVIEAVEVIEAMEVMIYRKFTRA